MSRTPRVLAGPPESPVLLFDGVCGLCHAWVRFVLRHDHARQVRLAAVQSAPGQALLVEHGLAHLADDTLVYIADGQAYLRSDAVLRVLAALPWPWCWTRVLQRLPLAWRDGLYRAIARRRYWLFGRYAQCQLPDARERSRFLHD